MLVHPKAPSPSFDPQRGSIADPAATQVLSGEQADGDLSLVNQTSVVGRVVHRDRRYSQSPAGSPKGSTTALQDGNSDCPGPLLVVPRNFSQADHSPV